MNITKKLGHLTGVLRVINRYQIPLCSQIRCSSDTPKTVDELLAENAEYKKQIDDLKNKNVELISKNLGCMSQINDLKAKNADVEGKIHEILVRGDAMSSAYISERVRYAHEVSSLTEHLWHLLAILAQNREYFIRKAREDQAAEFNSNPKSVGDMQRDVEKLFAQVEKLQRQLKASRKEASNSNVELDQGQDFKLIGENEQESNVDNSGTPPKTVPSEERSQSNRAVSNMIVVAKTLYKEKQYDDAIELLLKAVDIEETGRKSPKVLGRLWYKLSVVYQEMANTDKSLEAVNTAIEYDPRHAPNFYRRANIHMALGDKSRAVEDLKKVVEMSPENAHAKDLLNLLTSPI